MTRLSWRRMIRLLHPPLPPSTISKLSLFLILTVCRPLSLIGKRGGGRGGGRSQIIQQRESLVLYNTLNTLCNYVSYCTGIPFRLSLYIDPFVTHRKFLQPGSFYHLFVSSLSAFNLIVMVDLEGPLSYFSTSATYVNLFIIGLEIL